VFEMGTGVTSSL